MTSLVRVGRRVVLHNWRHMLSTKQVKWISISPLTSLLFLLSALISLSFICQVVTSTGRWGWLITILSTCRCDWNFPFGVTNTRYYWSTIIFISRQYSPIHHIHPLIPYQQSFPDNLPFFSHHSKSLFITVIPIQVTPRSATTITCACMQSSLSLFAFFTKVFRRSYFLGSPPFSFFEPNPILGLVFRTVIWSATVWSGWVVFHFFVSLCYRIFRALWTRSWKSPSQTGVTLSDVVKMCWA